MRVGKPECRSAVTVADGLHSDLKRIPIFTQACSHLAGLLEGWPLLNADNARCANVLLRRNACLATLTCTWYAAQDAHVVPLCYMWYEQNVSFAKGNIHCTTSAFLACTASSSMISLRAIAWSISEVIALCKLLSWHSGTNAGAMLLHQLLKLIA